MEKHILSKSTFIRGAQCLKSLYLHKNRYFLRDQLSPEQRAKFTRGTNVGLFAQNLFPGGVDCKPKSPSQYQKSVIKTQELVIQGDAEVIYEATFQHDQVLIMLDILTKNDSRWNAYEIKSSLSISETYILDAALQYYVLVNSGIEIDKFFLVHINPNYVLHGDLDIHQLFSFTDVTNEIHGMESFVQEKIKAGKNAAQLKSSPQVDIGPHCHYPYPCDFIGHCWKHIPKPSIFDLPGFGFEEKFAMYGKGQILINQITDLTQFTPIQQRIVQSQQTGLEHFNSKKLKQFLAPIGDKTTFLSFLGYRPAIPVFENFKPYDVLPVNACISSKGNHPSTRYSWFFQNDKSDPQILFFDFVRKYLAASDSIVMFGALSFLEYLNRFGERFPSSKSDIEEIKVKIIDLHDVFKDMVYYNPVLKDDFSLQHIARILLRISYPELSPFPSDVLAIGAYQKYCQSKSQSERTIKTENLLEFGRANVMVVESICDFLMNKNKELE